MNHLLNLDVIAVVNDFVATFRNDQFRNAALFVAAGPFVWNIVARTEYRRKILTRIAGGPLAGCYFLALIIFCYSVARDIVVLDVVKSKATRPVPFIARANGDGWLILSTFICCWGAVLVAVAFYRLGIVGTYLGDYFGLGFCDGPITSFPFNYWNNPMYMGAVLFFLGQALHYNSLEGVYLAFVTWIVYRVAIHFEGSFLKQIYARHH